MDISNNNKNYYYYVVLVVNYSLACYLNSKPSGIPKLLSNQVAVIFHFEIICYIIIAALYEVIAR